MIYVVALGVASGLVAIGFVIGMEHAVRSQEDAKREHEDLLKANVPEPPQKGYGPGRTFWGPK